MPFEFEGAAVRVVKIDGEPWFFASDLANVLGYGQTNSLNKLLDPEDRRNKAFQNGGNYVNQSLISEAGLYQAIMSSTLPAAKRFKKWVTGTVLPAIRKDGAYIMGEEKVATGEMDEDELLSTNAHDRRQRCGGTVPMISQRAPESSSRHPGAAGRNRGGAVGLAQAPEQRQASAAPPAPARQQARPSLAGGIHPARQRRRQPPTQTQPDESPDQRTEHARSSTRPDHADGFALHDPTGHPEQHAPGSRIAPTHRQQAPSRSSRPAAAHHGEEPGAEAPSPSPLPWQANPTHEHARTRTATT